MANPIIVSEPKKTINGYESLWNASSLPIQYIISNDKYPVGAVVTNYYSEITIKVNGNDIATIQQLPDSDNNTKVDIRKFIQSALSFLPSVFLGTGNDTNGFCEFSISGFEKYIDNTGTPQSNSIDNGNNTFYSSISALQFGNQNGGNMYDYVLDSTKSDLAKWMTLFERGEVIDINNFTFSIIVNDPDFDLSVDQFDINGGLLENNIINIPDSGVGLYRLSTDLITLNDDVSYINIEGQKSSVPVTEILPVDVDLACIEIIPKPTNLILSNITTSSIQLDWTSNSAGEETGFGIERSLDGVLFSQIDTTLSEVTTFTDNTVTDGTEYYYRVRALSDIPSEYTNIESATTPTIYESLDNVFGLRRLTVFGTYACEIRRSSDNATTKILLPDTALTEFISLSSEVSDGGTLGDWVGANDATVVRWDNQSSTNTKDFFNNATFDEPSIITAGALNLKDGIPVITSNADSRLFQQHFGFPAPYWNATVDWTCFTISYNDADTFEGAYLHTNTNDSIGITLFRSRTVGNPRICRFKNLSGAINGDSSVEHNTNARVLNMAFNDSAAETFDVWDNGNVGDQNTSYAGEVYDEKNIGIFNNSLITNQFIGGISEIIQDGSDLTASRIAIRDEINSVHNVY